jgi:hypothetical protein
MNPRRLHPAAGSHLPSEDTAPICFIEAATAPFRALTRKIQPEANIIVDAGWSVQRHVYVMDVYIH